MDTMSVSALHSTVSSLLSTYLDKYGIPLVPGDEVAALHQLAETTGNPAPPSTTNPTALIAYSHDLFYLLSATQ